MPLGRPNYGSGQIQSSQSSGYNMGQNFGQSSGQSSGSSNNYTGIVPGMSGMYNQLLGLNQQNYQNMLGAYGQGASNLNQGGLFQGYDAIQQGLGNTLGMGAALGENGNWGIATPAAEAIQRSFANQRGQTDQNLVSAGLGNTTLRGNLQNQNRLMQGQALGNLGSQLAGQYAGYQHQIGQNLMSDRMEQMGMGNQLAMGMGNTLGGYQFANTLGNLTGGFGSSQNQSSNQGMNYGWNQGQNQNASQSYSPPQSSYGQGATQMPQQSGGWPPQTMQPTGPQITPQPYQPGGAGGAGGQGGAGGTAGPGGPTIINQPGYPPPGSPGTQPWNQGPGNGIEQNLYTVPQIGGGQASSTSLGGPGAMLGQLGQGMADISNYYGQGGAPGTHPGMPLGPPAGAPTWDYGSGPPPAGYPGVPAPGQNQVGGWQTSLPRPRRKR